MLASLSRNWWTLALRGLVAVVFGLMAWVWPDLTVHALVLLFGAYALVDGIFALISVLTGGGRRGRWEWLLLEGIGGVIIGLVTMVWPSLTALALLYLIAAWAVVTGVFEIAAAIELRRTIDNEWLLGIGGAASILLGVLLIAFPGTGALAVVWLIGAYAILFGLILIGLGWRLRNLPAGNPPDRPAVA